MGNYHSNSGYGSSNCNPCTENSCNAAVLTSDTLTNADNYPWKGGEFKIPKVLAEFVVQVDTEAKIKLNDTAYEIKRVEKQVFLTQCRYIPPTDKVFLEGYIRKNIEYASKTCFKGHAIGGTIKDTTVHIPFKAYTKIDFGCNRPIITPNLPPMVARYFDEQRLGKNIREADRSDIEIFNEPVYCELEWTAVFDANIDDAGTPICGFRNEEEFQEYTDKSVVYICLKLLQKQQVNFHDGHGKDCGKECNKSDDFKSSDWNFPINDIIRKDKN